MPRLTPEHHILVLLGGWSAEREVSLSSGRAVLAALQAAGYRAEALDVGRDAAAKIAAARPDVVFNALHGRFGEDGCVQGMLEVLGVPYTHSGVLASALAMDKPLAKLHFAAAGIPVAEGVVVTRAALLAADPMPRPFVVKPLNEGSSVGVQIVREGEAITPPEGEIVLVEEYVAGHEVQAAVLDGKPLGAIEIRPKSGFYDYAAKYTDGLAEHLMPAPIAPEAYARVLDYAARAHAALGCAGLTRSDFMVDDRSSPARIVPARIVLLETNTQPGMTPLSLAPEIAAHAGMDFTALVVRLLEIALDSTTI